MEKTRRRTGSRWAIIVLCLGLCGCAGSGAIKKYDVIDGKKVLKSIWEFEGRNIRAKTEDGAEMETKNLEFPSLPSTIIGK